jgi:hypothetical protein
MRKFARGFSTVLVLVGVGMLGSARVNAETELGESCWGFSDFGDLIRLTLVQADSAADTFIALHGKWQFPDSAPALYQLEVAGHMSDDNVSPGQLAFGITGSHMTTFFGGDQNCSLNASLDPGSLSGSYRLVCSPGPGASPFIVMSGTLVSLACPAGANPQKRPGPGIGEANRK